MITSKPLLINALTTYRTLYKEEQAFGRAFIELLRNDRCYFRDHLPGHLTGSAFIVDESKSFVLLTHHAKLNKWLQPGGHADGDENIMAVALREAEEETGLKHLKSLTDSLFDIDIHGIPERKDFPAHLHYDVRFLFEASTNDDLIISEESHDLAWIPLDRIAGLTNHNNAVLRMVHKLTSF